MAEEEVVGLLVVVEVFLFGVVFDGAVELCGDGGEVADGGGALCGFGVGGDFAA